MWFSSAKRESKDVIYKNQPYKAEGTKPNNRSYSVHTSKVTYGGADGAYYTSTRTRRAGSDGVSVILWESESGLFSVILLFFNFIFRLSQVACGSGGCGGDKRSRQNKWASSA